MSADTMKYYLKDFNEITQNGFNYELSDDIIEIISDLARKVGSSNYIKKPIFKKNINNDNNNKEKRRKNKNINLDDESFDLLRNFQSTKILEKNGLDIYIDELRLNINKITPSNYIDYRNKIIDTVKIILSTYISDEEIYKVSSIIFDIASTNRFYSEIYAELYSDLINQFEQIRKVFNVNFEKFFELFDNIEYIDPNIDYNKFCEINKINEKRRSLSNFFINLMKNNIIKKVQIVRILEKLLCQLTNYITEENKKNEVDEITENIALLYSNDFFNNDNEDDYDIDIDGLNITETIQKLATSNVKDYKSLSNKSIFKFMDLIEE